MAKLFKTGITSEGDITAGNNLRSSYTAGDEGGQIFLNKATTNTTLTSGVNIDVYQNKLRFWEDGGTNRGFYIDMTTGGTSVGTNLVGGGSYTLPAATSTALGGVELFSDTVQSVAANSVTTTASRTYGLQVNAAGQGVVNVPWTAYTLPTATSTVLGGIELFSDTQQSVAANAVTATASRTYGIQLNAALQGVVNVPWTDTVYTAPTLAGTTLTSGGTITTLSGNLTTGGLTSTAAVNLNYASPTIASNNASAASIFTSTVTGVTIGSSTIRTTTFPADATTSTATASAGYMGMPQNSRSASYTLVAADAGKHIYMTATGFTITIPLNSSVAFPVGTTITFVSGNGVSTTISCADTFILAGAGTAASSKTLAAYGVATAIKIASTTWIISGNGLT
jgi:hypothetical protein